MVTLKTVVVIIRNTFSKHMNHAIVGRTLAGDYVLSSDECGQFAHAIRDTRAIDSAFVSPFIFARIFLSPVKQILFDSDSHVNLVRMVHGDVHLKLLRPFRVNQRLRYTLSVHDITDTPAGEILRFSGRVYEGETLVAEITSGFPVRTGKRHSRPHGEAVDSAKKVLHQFELQTEKGQSREYAAASGDMNPIHRSALFAKIAGFGSPIMHGMCVMAMCERAIVNKLTGDNSTCAREAGGRFSHPVNPGERLIIRMYETTDGGLLKTCPFDVINEKGKTVIKNGIIVV